MTSLPPRPPPVRLVELDALRFFAVLGVMAVHFSPGSLGRFGPWGDWGVRFFFVLSGFLITQLLLSARRRVDAGKVDALREFGWFCIRRALRLWPVYFLVVLGAAAWGIAFARDMLPWNLLFAGNCYIAWHDQWPGLMSHLWTLAAEQQFYLLWPLLILFVPPACITAVLRALIVTGPLFRLAERIILPHEAAPFVLLPACADYFAWGGLLAWNLEKSDGLLARLPAIACGWLAGLAFAVSLAGFYAASGDVSPAPWAALSGTLVAAGSVLLIRHCVAPGDSPLKAVLRFPVFVYLGSISYGIYLYHNFTHRIGPALLRRLTGENYFHHEWAHVLYYAALSISIASLSWHLLERPINRFRHRLVARVGDR